MEDLQYLIEAELSVANKINTAATALKDWFSEKKAQCSEFFSGLVIKIKDFFRKNPRAKETNAEEVSAINKLMTQIKNICNSILSLCQSGINFVLGRNVSKASSFKSKITSEFAEVKSKVSLAKKAMSIINKYVDKKVEYKLKKDGTVLHFKERELERREERLNRRHRF